MSQYYISHPASLGFIISYVIVFVIGLLVSIGFGILCGIVTKKIVERKGYSAHWFWLGFFLGVWGIIIALIMTLFNSKEDVKLKNVELLNKYKKLLDDGIISQEEFQAKKEELLTKC